ncbi:uncharacterized protein BJX67DRAFT_96326 [Aspergillus lucknowensis]|uniref:Uncharacterized protein n=1 Tax=Aspergillus lucknowensis TaxID=176173 RepID=A0ABR4M602_9EURO
MYGVSRGVCCIRPRFIWLRLVIGIAVVGLWGKSARHDWGILLSSMKAEVDWDSVFGSDRQLIAQASVYPENWDQRAARCFTWRGGLRPHKPSTGPLRGTEGLLQIQPCLSCRDRLDLHYLDFESKVHSATPCYRKRLYGLCLGFRCLALWLTCVAVTIPSMSRLPLSEKTNQNLL